MLSSGISGYQEPAGKAIRISFDFPSSRLRAGAFLRLGFEIGRFEKALKEPFRSTLFLVLGYP
jgi:hypothetical protein